jgi:predicted Zn-dependent protease
VQNRDDYLAFREGRPGLLEPNYLPFMLYEVPVRPASAIDDLVIRLGLRDPPERRLVVCHWAPEDFPLRVWIEPPTALEVIEDDTPGIQEGPAGYVEAVEEALAAWQDDLDGAVRFEPAASAEDADLLVLLLAERAPEPEADVRVYGTAAVGDSCQVKGGDPSRRLDVRFRVGDVRLYVADAFGLLLPEQVKGIARHEIGHALGMRGHSPIPADLMFEEADDRRDRAGLGFSDINSFLSLYSLPSGTVYADPARIAVARPLLPEGEPRLHLAPHVDTRLGFEVQLPEGWQRQPTPYGVVAVNGVPWDYDASFQLNVFRFDSIDAFVERFGPAYLRGGVLLSVEDREIAGRRARVAEKQTRAGTRELLTLIESGDGRVLLAIAECAEDEAPAYRPWFAAVLESLELAGQASAAQDREYRPEGAR